MTWTLLADILSSRLAEVSSTIKSKPHLKISLSLSKTHPHAHVPSGAVTERSTRPGAGGIGAGRDGVHGRGSEPNSLSKRPHPPLTARPKSKILSAGILYILRFFATNGKDAPDCLMLRRYLCSGSLLSIASLGRLIEYCVSWSVSSYHSMLAACAYFHDTAGRRRAADACYAHELSADAHGISA